MHIDALEFSRAMRVAEGRTVAHEFTRLCQDLPQPQDGEISWQVSGRHDVPTGRMGLGIQAQGQVSLVCQRCLEAMPVLLQVDNVVGLARDQARLDALDALDSSGEGSDIEYVLADQRLDLLALIEDELILVLPYAPRHDVCPVAVDQADSVAQDKSSPFAVLEQLRKH
ncbi:YceD family protein [Castellaniella sp.]|uniref:YceD family protein n=1 Tax=Castellaniella sp. TaxID=1955812 RepID=UPI002AFE858D|nr:YceD family protein [Castellaniella sp.]